MSEWIEMSDNKQQLQLLEVSLFMSEWIEIICNTRINFYRSLTLYEWVDWNKRITSTWIYTRSLTLYEWVDWNRYKYSFVSHKHGLTLYEWVDWNHERKYIPHTALLSHSLWVSGLKSMMIIDGHEVCRLTLYEWVDWNGRLCKSK